MEQLIYASRATRNFSNDELAELLTKARENNLKRSVTGMLVYHEGSFLQVIEGEHDELAVIYRRITADPRHSEIQLLSRQVIERRTFGDWTMGYVDSREASVEQLAGFVDFFSTSMAPKTLVNRASQAWAFLRAFRNGRWRGDALPTALVAG